MKRVSEGTKGKVMVIGSIPSLVLALAGMLCIVVDAATRINSAWLGMLCLCLGLAWFSVGFSVSAVLDFWPQNGSRDDQ